MKWWINQVDERQYYAKIGFKKERRKKKENKEKKRDNIYSQKIVTEVDENWKICDYKQEWIKQVKGNIMLIFFLSIFFFFLVFNENLFLKFKRILWKDLGLDM